VGQYFFGFVLGWFPVQGWTDSTWKNLITYAPLPVLLAVMVGVSPQTRLYRSFFLDELGQDYVRTARSKGLSRWRVVWHHAARNALHIGGHGFGNEVVVLGAGQLFQAIRLLVLADEYGGLTVETVGNIVVEELVGTGIITDDPVPHAWAFALQDQFGAAHAEIAVRAIDRIGTEHAEVVVVPVGIGLDEAFEGHFRAPDDIDGVLGTGSVGKREQDSGGKQGIAGFHRGILVR
jgi:hypothetical protein